MVTSSVESVQVPLWIVHRNTLAPYPKLLTPELGLLGVVIVPLPLTKLHVPLPAVAVFPASVAVLVSQKLWFGPALAVVGLALTVTVGWLVGLTSEPPQSAGCRAALVQVNGEPTVDAGAVAWTEKTTCSPPSSLAELEFAVT